MKIPDWLPDTQRPVRAEEQPRKPLIEPWMRPLVPGAIYLFVHGGGPGRSGWGIPMATDIAFVVGFLALLGPRVPFGLKILLLTLAIVDDIGAILVIAAVYTANTSLSFLIIGMTSFGVIYLFRWIGVRMVPCDLHQN